MKTTPFSLLKVFITSSVVLFSLLVYSGVYASTVGTNPNPPVNSTPGIVPVITPPTLDPAATPTTKNTTPSTTVKTTPKATTKTTTTSNSTTSNSTTNPVDSWGCDALKAQIEAAGGGRAAQLPSYCSEGDVYKKIVYWLYFILGIGAVISIIYGGYLYMTAGSSESQTKKSKNIIMYTLAGVSVAIIATVIVTIVVNLILDNKLF